MNRAALKQTAKNKLGSNIFSKRWMMFVLAFLITGAIGGAISACTSGIGAIIGAVFGGMLIFGISVSFLALYRQDKDLEIPDIFVAFKTFGDQFLLSFMLCLFIALWSLLFVVPGLIKGLGWSMTYYIKADHPEYTYKQCMAASKQMTMGHKWELFVLILSFIGWYLVGVATCGIGMLWVETYASATITAYYEELKNAPVAA